MFRMSCHGHGGERDGTTGPTALDDITPIGRWVSILHDSLLRFWEHTLVFATLVLGSCEILIQWVFRVFPSEHFFDGRSDVGVDPFAYGEDTSPESRMRQANLQPWENATVETNCETKRREIIGNMKHRTFRPRGVWVTTTLLITFHVALVRIPSKDPCSMVEFNAFVLISPCAACAVAWLGTLSWGGWCGDSVEVVNWIKQNRVRRDELSGSMRNDDELWWTMNIYEIWSHMMMNGL